jgi:hypothetical protein
MTEPENVQAALEHASYIAETFYDTDPDATDQQKNTAQCIAETIYDYAQSRKGDPEALPIPQVAAAGQAFRVVAIAAEGFLGRALRTGEDRQLIGLVERLKRGPAVIIGKDAVAPEALVARAIGTAAFARIQRTHMGNLVSWLSVVCDRCIHERRWPAEWVQPVSKADAARDDLRAKAAQARRLFDDGKGMGPDSGPDSGLVAAADAEPDARGPSELAPGTGQAPPGGG